MQEEASQMKKTVCKIFQINQYKHRCTWLLLVGTVWFFSKQSQGSNWRNMPNAMNNLTA